jgi:hypothetical protein
MVRQQRLGEQETALDEGEDGTYILMLVTPKSYGREEVGR